MVRLSRPFLILVFLVFLTAGAVAGEGGAPDRGFVPTPECCAFFQMGAYRTETNAKVLVRALTRRGYEPQVRREGSLLRVFLTVRVSEAPDLARKLTAEGWKGFLQLSREPRGEPVILTTE